MFSLKENGEFEIITNLSGGSTINPSMVVYEDNENYLKVDTKGMILVNGTAVELDDYYKTSNPDVPADLKGLANDDGTDLSEDQAIAILDKITKVGFEAVLKAVGPKVLVNLLTVLGFKGVKTSNGATVPETLAQMTLRKKEEAEAKAVKEEEGGDDLEGGALTEQDQRNIALNRIVSYFRGSGAKFLNRENIDTTADSETGVQYNRLKETVDYEALQHQINEAHLRFKLSIQGLFGSIGYNPKITVGVSGVEMAGGYSVTNDQLKGGMLPALVPISIVSKVPSFSGDIESKINQAINLLKGKNKTLTGPSKQQIETVINKVKEEEKQLMKLATSLENIAKDPNAPGDITQEVVEKYSDKLKTHQVKTIDIAKALLNIVSTVPEPEGTVELTTDKPAAE